MLKKIILPLLLMIAGRSLAQDRDLMDLNYSTSKLNSNDTIARAGLLNAKLRIPVYYNKKDAFIASVDYRHLSFNGFPEYYSGSLQGASMLLIYNRKLSETKSFAVFGRLGLFSDFENTKSDDFQYGFGINYDVKHSDRFTTGFGFLYAKQFFGNQIVPFMNIDYKISGKWRLTGRFPVKEKLLYQISDKVSAGVELTLENSSYRLTGNESQKNFIKITDCAVLARFEYKIAKFWLLYAGGGFGLIQRYEIYAEGSGDSWTIFTIALNKKEKPLEELNSRGFTGQIGVSYSLF